MTIVVSQTVSVLMHSKTAWYWVHIISSSSLFSLGRRQGRYWLDWSTI